MADEFSFDDVIDDITGSGKYQFYLVMVAIYYSIPSAFMLTGSVFYAASPASRCTILPFDNRSLFPNATDQDINEVFIPWNPVTQSYDRCSRKVFNTTSFHNSTFSLTNYQNETQYEIIPCNDGYTYDLSTFESTIVTQWNLVCGRSLYLSISTSIFYFGIFLGSLIGGILADKFGRVFIFRSASLLVLICGSCVYFAPNILIFTVVRFLVAVIYFQGIVAGFTYGAEVSPKKWRVRVSLGFNSSFGVGCILLTVVAYFCRDWRTFVLATTLFGFGPAVLATWGLVKSPRWLCAQGKFEEARLSCEKMARNNGTVMSEELWEATVEHYSKEQANDLKVKQAKNKDTLLGLVQRPCTRYMILSNMFIWMVTSMVYYGLILNSGSLAGSIYINNAIGGAMEMIALIIAMPIVSAMGCTKPSYLSLFAASFACLISTAVTHFSNGNHGLEIFGTVLAMIGRFSTSLTFGIIYLHTAENFPTAGRTTALGISSMAARIGSIFSPFTVQFQHTMPWVSPVIFGIAALLAACVYTTFPDTKGKELTTTFIEAERGFYNHLKKSLISCFFASPKRKRSTADDNEEALFMNETNT